MERCAETLAALHDLPADERIAFLVGLGFSVESWAAFDRAWTTELARAGGVDQGRLAVVFASAASRDGRGAAPAVTHLHTFVTWWPPMVALINLVMIAVLAARHDQITQRGKPPSSQETGPGGDIDDLDIYQGRQGSE